jgi:hypothetical protein
MTNIKPNTELCSILDRNGKLVWTQDAYLRRWMEHFMKLLTVQTDSEDITENNYTTENGYVPDKIQVNKKTDIQQLSYQSTRRETGNNVEIIQESCCCVRFSKFTRGY